MRDVALKRYQLLKVGNKLVVVGQAQQSTPLICCQIPQKYCQMFSKMLLFQCPGSSAFIQLQILKFLSLKDKIVALKINLCLFFLQPPTQTITDIILSPFVILALFLIKQSKNSQSTPLNPLLLPPYNVVGMCMRYAGAMASALNQNSLINIVQGGGEGKKL